MGGSVCEYDLVEMSQPGLINWQSNATLKQILKVAGEKHILKVGGLHLPRYPKPSVWQDR